MKDQWCVVMWRRGFEFGSPDAEDDAPDVEVFGPMDKEQAEQWAEDRHDDPIVHRLLITPFSDPEGLQPPAMTQDWETPCEPSPDGKHCEHWYDGEPCHYCGDDTGEVGP